MAGALAEVQGDRNASRAGERRIDPLLAIHARRMAAPVLLDASPIRALRSAAKRGAAAVRARPTMDETGLHTRIKCLQMGVTACQISSFVS
jgi:hypothetical protein